MEDSISLWFIPGPPNDIRGWIMTIISGLACMLGASIIFADIPMQLIPRYRNFKIQDSTKFLSSSMALSFGVMAYSSLFSLLPESLSYFKKSDFSRRKAGFISIGCFVGGAMAIMIVSKILHRFMPSHAVGCDHSHTLEEEDTHDHEHEHRPGRSRSRGENTIRQASRPRSHETMISPSEESPLLEFPDADQQPKPAIQISPPKRPRLWQSKKYLGLSFSRKSNRNQSTSSERRLSMIEVPQKIKEFMLDRKVNCDEGGPCYGYSETCGQGCLKIVRNLSNARRPSSFVRQSSGITNLREIEEEHDSDMASTAPMLSTRSHSHDSSGLCKLAPRLDTTSQHSTTDLEAQDQDTGAHHHHIPTNTFLDLSLQTSIAIALHKIPEGFITYATNHVNPGLGVSVFIALLFHNITEGFALALPLYLATNSRLRALIYAAVLGGLSQPLGALIAYLWFMIAGSADGAGAPSNTLYGCMFAITAGIMMSVGISLFCEAMAFNHNRNLCIAFAFAGMGILGITGSLSGGWK